MASRLCCHVVVPAAHKRTQVLEIGSTAVANVCHSLFLRTGDNFVPVPMKLYTYVAVNPRALPLLLRQLTIDACLSTDQRNIDDCHVDHQLWCCNRIMSMKFIGHVLTIHGEGCVRAVKKAPHVDHMQQPQAPTKVAPPKVYPPKGLPQNIPSQKGPPRIPPQKQKPKEEQPLNIDFD